MKLFGLSLLFALLFAFGIATASPLSNLTTADMDKVQVIRLINGDIITGEIIEFVSSEAKGDGIRFRTLLGTTLIYESEIASVRAFEDYNRHSHRSFLMPTALPIGDNHFVGCYELLFLYGGFGIGDVFSCTAGKSFAPGARWDQQLSELNAKFTVYQQKFDNQDGAIALAAGANLAFVNDNNRLIHAYAVGTYTGTVSHVSAAIFTKLGSQDYAQIKFNHESIDMNYPDGAFGLAFGLDTKFARWNNLYFIGEIWNNDIDRASNTAILLGVRHASTRFSADFGLAFFTQPFAVPFISFVWTPFNS